MSAENEVRILVRAKDETGPVMAAARRRGEELKDTNKGVLSGLKGLFGAALALGGIEMFKSIIEKSEIAEKTTRRTEAVLKSTGEAAHISSAGIDKLTTSLSNATGVYTDTIRNGENLMLTFTGVRNEVGKGNDIFNRATKASLDMTAALNHGKITSEGLASSTTQLGKALNDPAKGYARLQRIGITFSKQQQEEIKHGSKLAGQQIILAEVQKKYAGAAAASTSVTDKLKNTFQNLQLSVGKAILPSFEKLVVILQKVMDYVSRNQKVIMPMVAAFAAVATVLYAVEKAQKAWTAATKLWTVVTKVATGIQWLFNAALDANPIGLIILGIAALVVVIVLIATKTQWFQKAWKASWSAIKDAAAAVWNWLKHNWPYILGILTGPIGLATVMIIKHWKQISAGVAALGRDIKRYWNDAVSFVRRIAADVTNYVRSRFTGLVNFLRSIPGSLHRAMSGMFNFIGREAESAYHTVTRWLQGIVNFARSIPGKVGGALSGLGSSALHMLGFAHGGITAAATGGLRQGSVLVGENGPEVVQLPGGSHVYSHGDSKRLYGHHGGGGQHITLEVVGGGGEFETAMANIIKHYVRIRGGNVQSAFGR